MTENEIDWTKPPKIYLYDRQTKNFETWQEFHQWAANQSNFWKNQTRLGAHFHFLKGIIFEPQVSRFNDLSSFLGFLVKNQKPELERAKASIPNFIKMLADGRMLPEEANIVQEALAHLQSDPELWVGILASFLKEVEPFDVNTNRSNIDESTKNAIAYVRGELARHFKNGQVSLEAERKANAILRGESADEFDGLIREISSRSDDIHGVTQKALTEFNEKAKGYGELAKQLLDSLAEDQEKHRAEMEAIQKAFSAEMALKAPRAYWGKVYWQSFLTAMSMFIMFSVIAAAVARWAFVSSPETIYALNQMVSGTTPLHVITGLIALPVIMVLWVMRHISRLFISNLTQARDAQYRTTMIETYLALMKDPEAKMERSDVAMILQALFRPPDGYTAEESMPSTAVDAIKAAVSGGR